MTNTKDSWKMFDQISSYYDSANRILSFGMDRSWRRRLAKLLPKQSHLNLLDIASGTGDQLIACMESNASIHSAIGVDLATDMLEIAKQKILKKPYCNQVSFTCADAQNLPFLPQSFNAITCAFGIRNIPDTLGALKQMKHALASQGRCLILEFSLPGQPWKTPYLWYLRHLLPRIGGVIAKNFEAYRYLNQTIELFPSGKSFCLLMQQAGFVRVQATPLCLGSVTLYQGDVL